MHMVTAEFISLTLNALEQSRVKLSILKDHPYCISIFQIYHMNYLDQDFIKLKYSDASASIFQRDQFYLDPHTDFISTWLYLVAFCHYIRNIDSLALKHSELFASYYDDLRFEKHLYPYTLRAALNSRTLSRWVICLVMMYSYISLMCHISISTLFG